MEAAVFVLRYVPGFRPSAVEPHDGGDTEGRDAQQADDRAREEKGRRQSDLTGQESRAEQADGRRQQTEAAVEREYPPQRAGFDAGLDDGDERGVEDAARDAGCGREDGEPDESRGGQQSREQERKPYDQVHEIDQHDAAHVVGPGAHEGPADERSAAPDDLDEAHFEGSAAEVLQRHEREEHADGHDEKPYGDRKGEEPAHARRGVHGGESFAELAQQGGFPFRVAGGAGNPHEEQRDAGCRSARDVEQENVADRGDGEQQGAESRSGDVRERGDHLIDPGDARELGGGGQQRDGGLHGGGVECRSDRAAGQQDVDMPHLRDA